MAARVKKGDHVMIVAGRDKGARGDVIKVIPRDNRVVVRDVNVVKRHIKPTQADPKGGVKMFEAPIHVSNVALTDPRDSKPTRIGFRIDEHGRKTRFAKRSGEAIDG